MLSITIRYGATNELSKSVRPGTTVQNILSDTTIQGALGFGSNVQALSDGQVLSSTATLSDGDVLVIETKANSKA